MTRGRLANHVHVALPGSADEHAPIRRDTLVPPTAIDLLERVLDREGSQRSATTELREGREAAARLRNAIAATWTRPPRGSPTSHRAERPLPWLRPPPSGDDAAAQHLAARAAGIRGGGRGSRRGRAWASVI